MDYISIWFSDGWVEFEGNCYQLHKGLPMKWEEAEHMCTTSGAHLASIHSQAEEAFLTQLAQQYYPIWLGGTDAAAEVSSEIF